MRSIIPLDYMRLRSGEWTAAALWQGPCFEQAFNETQELANLLPQHRAVCCLHGFVHPQPRFSGVQMYGHAGMAQALPLIPLLGLLALVLESPLLHNPTIRLVRPYTYGEAALHAAVIFTLCCTVLAVIRRYDVAGTIFRCRHGTRRCNCGYEKRLHQYVHRQRACEQHAP